jgi:hypothetical protein
MKFYFKCGSCERNQRLEVGAILCVLEGKTATYMHELEAKCKFCGSYDMRSFYIPMAVLASTSRPNPEVGVAWGMEAEGKAMPMKKMLPYFERRLLEEPENGELHLRYANALRKHNKYPQALKEYETAERLDPALIAVYANMAQIFMHRHWQYKEKGAKEIALQYIRKWEGSMRNGKRATLPSKRIVQRWLASFKQERQPAGFGSYSPISRASAPRS